MKEINIQDYLNNIILITIGRLVKSNCQKLAKIDNKICKNQKVKYRLNFSLVKDQLIHIIKKQNIDYISEVKLKGFLVKEAITIINLGIILNSKLSWKNYILKIKEEAIKNLGVLSSITGSTWGSNYHLLCKIFKVVIIFQLFYKISIWYALTEEKKNQKTLMAQLVQAQTIEIRFITKAFKAISAQALNIQVYLTSINLELDQKIIDIIV